ncbi:PAAR domain-containing protein [Tritonibacter sp. SIMBA_163]
MSAGSGSVLVNGKPAGRVGDAIACGGAADAGSSDVRFGD